MIPNQWYAVLEAHRLRKKPLGLERLGEKWVLWRDADGHPRAALDRCPHRGATPSKGKVVGGELQCPWHGFRFGPDGRCTLMPCEGSEARIPRGMELDMRTLREAHGLLWVFHGSADPASVPIQWFDEFADGLTGRAEASFLWPFNYVRTLESNFDTHHFPFVHGGGRVSGERVVFSRVEENDGHLRTEGCLRHEHKSSGLDFRIEYKPPAITLLEFPGFFFVVVDCPIDEGNTWRYARYAQTMTRIPGLAWALSWLALQLDLRVFQNRQDEWIMATQQPDRPDQGLEHLVGADAGTAAFKNLRHRLRREAGLEVAIEAEVRADSPGRDGSGA
jgi:phenylpropionate dioxygenase-like ring-hydroxylating dioxygenase large terminal subunit